MITAPWNAMWTGEDRFELRPCRFAGGRIAIWQPHIPGSGTPSFAEPHIVRQRRSIAEMRCTVCGDKTFRGDRWWFEHGVEHIDHWMTTEAPVHRNCADLALEVCPHLRARGMKPSRFPDEGVKTFCAEVRPESVPELFGLPVPSSPPIGQMKLGWPMQRFRWI